MGDNGGGSGGGLWWYMWWVGSSPCRIVATQTFFAQLLRALQYLHEIVIGKRGSPKGFPQGLVHGDLKAENVMFTSRLVLKLIDLDSARAIGRPADAPCIAGPTICSTSPEYYRAWKANSVGSFIASAAHDIFCAGLIIYEVVSFNHRHLRTMRRRKPRTLAPRTRSSTWTGWSWAMV